MKGLGPFLAAGRAQVLMEGSPVYLGSDDASGDRVFQVGIIAAMAPDRWTIDFETSESLLEVGDERLIYFTQIKKFIQRPVQVEERSENGTLSRVVMKFIGDAIPADTRQENRVSANDAELEVTLDTEEGCTVEDISMSGLGVICRRKHSIDQPLGVTVRYKDDQFSGRMTVQYGLGIDSERTRYGLRGLFDAGDGSPLRSGLTRTTLAVHRQQL
jgi:hypothetical protein